MTIHSNRFPGRITSLVTTSKNLVYTESLTNGCFDAWLQYIPQRDGIIVHQKMKIFGMYVAVGGVAMTKRTACDTFKKQSHCIQPRESCWECIHTVQIRFWRRLPRGWLSTAMIWGICNLQG